MTRAPLCAALLLLLPGCAWLSGAGAPPPAIAAAAAGGIVAYPAAVRGCIKLADTPVKRAMCVEVARSAFETSVDVFDEAVDAELDELAERAAAARSQAAP